ncbi:MAG TPA: Gfo/Idh/MocA family oxidoreductase [Pseudonocardiaceae bacterium]|nr:Gfo/Idh/MocA family oxidoreductase [Pseudonocardiaceae bacterium]
MTQQTLRVAVNGVTGRMGYNQHLVRSLLAIREQGGFEPNGPGGGRVTVEPVLLGRNADRLKEIAAKHDVAAWSTDRDAVLSDSTIDVFFDAALTDGRAELLTAAIAAGKHVYTEKPVASTLPQAIELAKVAVAKGIVHGVVQDKLFLPGVIKLRRLVESGFFGRILSVRLEFGYWVFEGDLQPAQRPSWNYRTADGGGIVLDMFPHWRYVLENVFGPVEALYVRATTHIPRRWDERHEPYDATADDAAYAVVELAGGIIASVNSSWAVRVNREELVEIQVDGTEGSAVAGLRGCKVQHRTTTPRPVWNPDLPVTENFPAQWASVPDNTVFDNGFKAQWELFLGHVVRGEPFPWDLVAGAKGVQMAELAYESSTTGSRVTVPDLEV